MVNRSGELQQTVTPRFRGGEGYAKLRSGSDEPLTCLAVIVKA